MIMLPSGTSATHAATAAQQQEQLQHAAAPLPQCGPQASRSAGTAPVDSSNIRVRVNSPTALGDLHTDPRSINERFRKLQDKFPPSREFSQYLDSITLRLHCPPPILIPTSTPSRALRRSQFRLAPYSAHAPVRRTAPPTATSATMENSNSLRYRIMGKDSPDPRFHYHPPSRPLSRVQSAAAMRTTSDPQSRGVGARNGDRDTAASHGGGSASRMQVVQKTCAVCHRLHDMSRTATKARYCLRCEKLRWQLRAFGGKVQHLRGAFEQLGDTDDSAALLEVAKRLAKADEAEVATLPPASAAAPAVVDVAPGKTSAGYLASGQRPAFAGRSSAGAGEGKTGGDVEMADVAAGEGAGAAARPAGQHEGLPAAAAGDTSEEGTSEGGKRESGAGDGTVKDAQGSGVAEGGDDDLDELAALLAGTPSNVDTGAAAAEQADPVQRRVAMVPRICDLCTQGFLTPVHSGATLCDTCDQLKSRAKKAGYTFSELQMGVGTGHIEPHAKPSSSEIRRHLGDMLLGKASKVPRGRRDRLAPTAPEAGGPSA